MKNRNKWALLLAFPLALIQVTGCSGEKDEEDHQTVTQDTVQNENMEDQVFYQIPTPNELFTVIKEIGGKGSPSLLNDPANGSKYTEPRQKSMVFGAYAADMAYASSYDFENTLDFLKVIKDMSKEMEIDGAFDETIFKAADENLENGDSLMKLSNQIYFKAYAYLEENERGPMLGQIVTGGWIESMFILVNIVGPYKDNDPIIQRIIDQKLNYENLYGFLLKYEEDENVQKTIADLEEIGLIFDSFELKDSDVNVESRDGVDVISGGTEIVPNKQGYEDLVNKIKELRNRIVSVNS